MAEKHTSDTVKQSTIANLYMIAFIYNLIICDLLMNTLKAYCVTKQMRNKKEIPPKRLFFELKSEKKMKTPNPDFKNQPFVHK